MTTTRDAAANSLSAFLVAALVVFAIAKMLGATTDQMRVVSGAMVVPPSIAALLAFAITFIPAQAQVRRSAASVGVWAGALTPFFLLGFVFLYDSMRGGSGGLIWNPFPFYMLMATPPLSILGGILGCTFGLACDWIRWKREIKP